MSEVQESIRYAGVDDGHFGIKLVGDDFKQFYLPSRIAEGAQIVSLSGGDEDNVWDTEEGVSYTVSESVSHIDTRFGTYAHSEVNRVLVLHALYQAGYAGQDVRMVSGLPIDDYLVGNKRNDDFIALKVDNLLKKTATNRNLSVKTPHIIGHSVSMEAVSAFYDLLYKQDGSIDAEFLELARSGKLAFIDIGGKTTDTAVVIDGGKNIDKGRSGTSPIGALTLNQAIETRIKHELNVSQLSSQQIESAARTGTLRMFGAEHDVSKLVNAEKQVLANQIVAEAFRKVGDGSDIERIHFLGGGSILLHDQLESIYPHAVFVEDPQFANARGMLKIAKYVKG